MAALLKLAVTRWDAQAVLLPEGGHPYHRVRRLVPGARGRTGDPGRRDARRARPGGARPAQHPRLSAREAEGRCDNQGALRRQPGRRSDGAVRGREDPAAAARMRMTAPQRARRALVAVVLTGAAVWAVARVASAQGAIAVMTWDEVAQKALALLTPEERRNGVLYLDEQELAPGSALTVDGREIPIRRRTG